MENIKKNCATILACLATIDGNVDSDEISIIAELYGISNDELYEVLTEIDTLDLADLLYQVSDSDEKYELLNNMILLCRADGKYDKEEKMAVRNICNVLDISEEAVTKAEKTIVVDIAKDKVSGLIKRFESKEEIKSGLKGVFEISESGTSVSHSVANGLGALNTRVSLALASAKKTKQENEQLREQLKSTTLTETVKQNVIVKLNSRISELKSQIEYEKQRNERNEEIIALLQSQIDELSETREMAEKSEIA